MKSMMISYFPNNLLPSITGDSTHLYDAVLRSWDAPEAVGQTQELASRYKDVAAVVVVGIGGSHRATMAIHHLIAPDAPLYYADTVDADYTQRLCQTLSALLMAGKRVLMVVISKSGATLETMVQAEVLYDLLTVYHPHDAATYVVVITDEQSQLWYLAQQHSWARLAIPAAIGGRFSAFTAVTLFPLAVVGLDIVQLLAGAQQMYSQITADVTHDARKSAQWLYTAMQQGAQVHTLFPFARDAYALGMWWQQLMAESLGKATHLDGSPVEQTLVPMVSMGTADLHAIGQLFLAGRAPIVTTFMLWQQAHTDVHVSLQGPYAASIDYLHTGSMHQIMQTIGEAVIQTYEQRKLPYMAMRIADKSMYSMGQLMQFYIHQVSYLAELLQINPLDQPEVTLYKDQVRKNLTHA